MKIAFLVNPIHELKAYKDSSVAMMKAAHLMGWNCFFFTHQDLFCVGSDVYAQMSSIVVKDLQSNDWAQIQPKGLMSLNECDLILMRKDPPFNTEYIYASYALELAERQGVFVANRPQSLRDVNEKFFILNFSSVTAKTVVSQNMQVLREFWQQEQDVIFKPLYGMGGCSVFRVDQSGLNLEVILEELTQNGQRSIMAQRFIPDIYEKGDKRILLINGEPVPYAMARIPKPGDMRGNLAAGARAEVLALTERDREICSTLSKTLKDRGLYFVGIDVIGDYLTEINVTSPTGI